MVRHPKLFIEALNEKDEQSSSERLRDGPEGGCEADLLRIIGLICRVHKQLPALAPLSAGLVMAYWRVHTRRMPMIPSDIRNSVRVLKAQGQSLREIGRLLKLSRDMVRHILREEERKPRAAPPCDDATLARLEEAFRRARGNGVRYRNSWPARVD